MESGTTTKVFDGTVESDTHRSRPDRHLILMIAYGSEAICEEVDL